jgi:FAD:protein FMN transferase
MRLNHTAIRAPLILLLTLLLGACGDQSQEETRTTTVLEGGIFGTFYLVTLPGEWPEQELAELQTGIRETLDAVDAGMSTYRDDSELNHFNNAPLQEWTQLSGPLMEVLDISAHVAEHTDGAFDVTVGALVNLWGFGPEGRPERRPDSETLEAVRADTGTAMLELDAEGGNARRMADFFVDLSGVAKGYGVDAIGHYLESRGIDNYLVNIGGDLLAGGRRSAERPWRIGVEQPDGRQPVDEPLIVPLEDMAVATSGDYRNFFEQDGRRYSHVIDPRTGRPIEHRLASVTVLHPSSAWADAYATGLLVLGTERALEVAAERDLKVVLISRTEDGFRTDKSPAMRAYLEAME